MEKSLPPLVEGDIQSTLIITINEIVFTKTSNINKHPILVSLEWWGNEQTPCRFYPHDIINSNENINKNNIETIKQIYHVKTNENLFFKYLKSISPLNLKIICEENQNLCGICSIENCISILNTCKYYPIIKYNSYIGDVKIRFQYFPNQIIYYKDLINSDEDLIIETKYLQSEGTKEHNVLDEVVQRGYKLRTAMLLSNLDFENEPRNVTPRELSTSEVKDPFIQKLLENPKEPNSLLQKYLLGDDLTDLETTESQSTYQDRIEQQNEKGQSQPNQDKPYQASDTARNVHPPQDIEICPLLNTINITINSISFTKAGLRKINMSSPSELLIPPSVLYYVEIINKNKLKLINNNQPIRIESKQIKNEYVLFNHTYEFVQSSISNTRIDNSYILSFLNNIQFKLYYKNKVPVLLGTSEPIETLPSNQSNKTQYNKLQSKNFEIKQTCNVENGMPSNKNNKFNICEDNNLEFIQSVFSNNRLHIGYISINVNLEFIQTDRLVNINRNKNDLNNVKETSNKQNKTNNQYDTQNEDQMRIHNEKNENGDVTYNGETDKHDIVKTTKFEQQSISNSNSDTENSSNSYRYSEFNKPNQPLLSQLTPTYHQSSHSDITRTLPSEPICNQHIDQVYKDKHINEHAADNFLTNQNDLVENKIKFQENQCKFLADNFKSRTSEFIIAENNWNSRNTQFTKNSKNSNTNECKIAENNWNSRNTQFTENSKNSNTNECKIAENNWNSRNTQFTENSKNSNTNECKIAENNLDPWNTHMELLNNYEFSLSVPHITGLQNAYIEYEFPECITNANGEVLIDSPMLYTLELGACRNLHLICLHKNNSLENYFDQFKCNGILLNIYIGRHFVYQSYLLFSYLLQGVRNQMKKCNFNLPVRNINNNKYGLLTLPVRIEFRYFQSTPEESKQISNFWKRTCILNKQFNVNQLTNTLFTPEENVLRKSEHTSKMHKTKNERSYNIKNYEIIDNFMQFDHEKSYDPKNANYCKQIINKNPKINENLKIHELRDNPRWNIENDYFEDEILGTKHKNNSFEYQNKQKLNENPYYREGIDWYKTWQNIPEYNYEFIKRTNTKLNEDKNEKHQGNLFNNTYIIEQNLENYERNEYDRIQCQLIRNDNNRVLSNIISNERRIPNDFPKNRAQPNNNIEEYISNDNNIRKQIFSSERILPNDNFKTQIYPTEQQFYINDKINITNKNENFKSTFTQSDSETIDKIEEKLNSTYMKSMGDSEIYQDVENLEQRAKQRTQNDTKILKKKQLEFINEEPRKKPLYIEIQNQISKHQNKSNKQQQNKTIQEKNQNVKKLPRKYLNLTKISLNENVKLPSDYKKKNIIDNKIRHEYKPNQSKNKCNENKTNNNKVRHKDETNQCKTNCKDNKIRLKNKQNFNDEIINIEKQKTNNIEEINSQNQETLAWNSNISTKENKGILKNEKSIVQNSENNKEINEIYINDKQFNKCNKNLESKKIVQQLKSKSDKFERNFESNTEINSINTEWSTSKQYFANSKEEFKQILNERRQNEFLKYLEYQEAMNNEEAKKNDDKREGIVKPSECKMCLLEKLQNEDNHLMKKSMKNISVNQSQPRAHSSENIIDQNSCFYQNNIPYSNSSQLNITSNEAHAYRKQFFNNQMSNDDMQQYQNSSYEQEDDEFCNKLSTIIENSQSSMCSNSNEHVISEKDSQKNGSKHEEDQESQISHGECQRNTSKYEDDEKCDPKSKRSCQEKQKNVFNYEQIQKNDSKDEENPTDHHVKNQICNDTFVKSQSTGEENQTSKYNINDNKLTNQNQLDNLLTNKDQLGDLLSNTNHQMDMNTLIENMKENLTETLKNPNEENRLELEILSIKSNTNQNHHNVNFIPNEQNQLSDSISNSNLTSHHTCSRCKHFNLNSAKHSWKQENIHQNQINNDQEQFVEQNICSNYENQFSNNLDSLELENYSIHYQIHSSNKKKNTHLNFQNDQISHENDLNNVFQCKEQINETLPTKQNVNEDNITNKDLSVNERNTISEINTSDEFNQDSNELEHIINKINQDDQLEKYENELSKQFNVNETKNQHDVIETINLCNESGVSIQYTKNEPNNQYDVNEVNKFYDINRLNNPSEMNKISNQHNINKPNNQCDIKKSWSHRDVNEASNQYDINEHNNQCNITELNNQYDLNFEDILNSINSIENKSKKDQIDSILQEIIEANNKYENIKTDQNIPNINKTNVHTNVTQTSSIQPNVTQIISNENIHKEKNSNEIVKIQTHFITNEYKLMKKEHLNNLTLNQGNSFEENKYQDVTSLKTKINFPENKHQDMTSQTTKIYCENTPNIKEYQKITQTYSIGNDNSVNSSSIIFSNEFIKENVVIQDTEANNIGKKKEDISNNEDSRNPIQYFSYLGIPINDINKYDNGIDNKHTNPNNSKNEYTNPKSSENEYVDPNSRQTNPNNEQKNSTNCNNKQTYSTDSNNRYANSNNEQRNTNKIEQSNPSSSTNDNDKNNSISTISKKESLESNIQSNEIKNTVNNQTNNINYMSPSCDCKSDSSNKTSACVRSNSTGQINDKTEPKISSCYKEKHQDETNDNSQPITHCSDNVVNTVRRSDSSNKTSTCERSNNTGQINDETEPKISSCNKEKHQDETNDNSQPITHCSDNVVNTDTRSDSSNKTYTCEINKYTDLKFNEINNAINDHAELITSSNKTINTDSSNENNKTFTYSNSINNKLNLVESINKIEKLKVDLFNNQDQKTNLADNINPNGNLEENLGDSIIEILDNTFGEDNNKTIEIISPMKQTLHSNTIQIIDEIKRNEFIQVKNIKTIIENDEMYGKNHEVNDEIHEKYGNNHELFDKMKKSSDKIDEKYEKHEELNSTYEIINESEYGRSQWKFKELDSTLMKTVNRHVEQNNCDEQKSKLSDINKDPYCLQTPYGILNVFHHTKYGETFLNNFIFTSIKIKEGKNFPLITISGKNHLPTTYVTLENIENTNSSYVWMSPVVIQTQNPMYDVRLTTKLPTSLLYKENENLIFIVWYKTKPDDFTGRSPSSDHVLGYVRINLNSLLTGLPSIRGWYNIINFSNKICGQLKIAINPLEKIILEEDFVVKIIPESNVISHSSIKNHCSLCDLKGTVDKIDEKVTKILSDFLIQNESHQQYKQCHQHYTGQTQQNVLVNANANQKVNHFENSTPKFKHEKCKDYSRIGQSSHIQNTNQYCQHTQTQNTTSIDKDNKLETSNHLSESQQPNSYKPFQTQYHKLSQFSRTEISKTNDEDNQNIKQFSQIQDQKFNKHNQTDTQNSNQFNKLQQSNSYKSSPTQYQRLIQFSETENSKTIEESQRTNQLVQTQHKIKLEYKEPNKFIKETGLNENIDVEFQTKENNFGKLKAKKKKLKPIGKSLSDDFNELKKCLKSLNINQEKNYESAPSQSHSPEHISLSDVNCLSSSSDSSWSAILKSNEENSIPRNQHGVIQKHHRQGKENQQKSQCLNEIENFDLERIQKIFQNKRKK